MRQAAIISCFVIISLLSITQISYTQEYGLEGYISNLKDSIQNYDPQELNRIDDILAYYQIHTGTDTLLPDELYYTAIDMIMEDVSPEPQLISFVVEYLLSIFDQNENIPAQVYIADKYQDEHCESDIVELVLSRMDGYNKMQTGTEAPEFLIRDRYNNTYRLKRMDNSYLIVMFWASTCDHCREMIPKLHEWYKTENSLDLEFVTISIDTSRYQFEDFVERHQLEWICAFDPLGWYGKVPEAYNVYATPSLFLLDEEHKIISKPFTYREFLREIKRL